MYIATAFFTEYSYTYKCTQGDAKVGIQWLKIESKYTAHFIYYTSKYIYFDTN